MERCRSAIFSLLLGCAAGKDVYVEKPCSHNLKEGRLMVEAARRHKRVVQHGTMYRSFPSFVRGMEYIHSGKIGKALMAKAWDVQLRDHIGHKEDGPVPAGVDFDTWTGRHRCSHSIQTAFTTTGTGIGTKARAMWASTECFKLTSPAGRWMLRRRSKQPEWAASSFLTTTRKRPTPST
jgi:hypothetical protein